MHIKRVHYNNFAFNQILRSTCQRILQNSDITYNWMLQLACRYVHSLEIFKFEARARQITCT